MKYKVIVLRTGYGSGEIEVEANSSCEAMEKAEDVAGEFSFIDSSSEYEAVSCEPISEVLGEVSRDVTDNILPKS